MNSRLNQDYLISKGSSALAALRLINDSAAHVAIVVDENKKLAGTLTDGDIRRGLLSGFGLDTPVEQLMNSRPRFTSEDSNKETMLQMMHEQGLRHLPIVDEEMHVKDLITLQMLLSNSPLPNPVVIMAGGKGLRLRPQTELCPKPMLPINGKPILEIIIKNCMANGFRKFYLSVNYMKEKIMDYFGDGGRWGITIEYLIESQPMGTAGSLRLLPKEVESPFLLINGDLLTKFDLKHILRFHEEHSASASLGVREYIETIPFGVVKLDGIDLCGFEEKPSYRRFVNAGVYVLDAQLLDLLGSLQFADAPTLLQNAKLAGHRVVACPIHEYWIDIGMPETLKQAVHDWTVGV